MPAVRRDRSGGALEVRSPKTPACGIFSACQGCWAKGMVDRAGVMIASLPDSALFSPLF